MCHCCVARPSRQARSFTVIGVCSQDVVGGCFLVLNIFETPLKSLLIGRYCVPGPLRHTDWSCCIPGSLRLVDWLLIGSFCVPGPVRHAY